MGWRGGNSQLPMFHNLFVLFLLPELYTTLYHSTLEPLIGCLGHFLLFLPHTTKLRQGNVFTLCHSVHRGVSASSLGGVCHTPWAHIPTLGTHTPPGHTPPSGQTSPCPVHAGIHTPLPSACWDTHPLHIACWDTVNKWAVCILLECILVFKKFWRT